LLNIFNTEKIPRVLGINYVPIEKLVFMSKIQPYSWFIFVKNNSLNSYLESNNIKLGELFDTYNMPYELHPTKCDSMAHYIQSTQEVCNDEKLRCKICDIGKCKILFGCHTHMTCVACSYRDNVCPFCRTPSNNKQKIKLFD
jgi:hypothetical protein